jgi:hypothetical protein
MPPRREPELTFAVDDEEEEERPMPRLEQTLLVREPFGPEQRLGPGEIPEGWLRIVHTTGKGVRLVEDHEGNLLKVVPFKDDL